MNSPDNYGTSIETATRPIYWNLSSHLTPVIMYALLFVSLLIMGNAILQRIVLWNAGVKIKRSFPVNIKRIFNSLLFILFQRRTLKERKAGIFHSLIFFGFLVLLLTTTVVFLHHDFNLDIYRGQFYLALTVASDLFGLLFLLGIALASHRRYVEKPQKLHISGGDQIMLTLLALLITQGFLLESLRLHSSNDPWGHFSFVGFGLSKIFWGLSVSSAKTLHFLIWWFHTVTVFTFFALIPYTKFFHIISSSLNLFFTETEKPKGRLPSTGDIEKLMEEAMSSSNDDFSLGIATLGDLDWKRRLDLDACTSCGRCQEVCPAYNSGKMLSPKFLILDLRDHMLSVQSTNQIPLNSTSGPFSLIKSIAKIPLLRKIDSFLLANFLINNSPSLKKGMLPRSPSELVQNSVRDGIGKLESNIAGEVMGEDVFWSCTTCRACMEVCPVNIEHVDLITEVRRNLVLIQGKLPTEAQGPLRSMESQGTPLGTQSERADWTEGLDINFLTAGNEVEVLYWVGCISAFDKRKQQIAKSMVKILNLSGKSWGMLGNLEKCTGDPARRLGDENTFQMMAKSNIGTLQSISFKTLVTHCPHCFNSIKNEYPEFGELSKKAVRILHHTTMIHELIANKLIAPNKTTNELITFHDPCYLGRYNDEYDAPREVLVQLGKTHLTEMSASKEKSKCCGAGGGHYWFDMKVGERVNTQRIQQATETGAKVVATACPFCMQMLEDGIKLSNQDEQLSVKDIAELVAEAL